MKNVLLTIGTLFLLALSVTVSRAQVTYSVRLDADKIAYRVYMTSTTAYTGNQARISTAQATLVVPHGTGANQFLVTNQVNKQVGGNQMVWNLNARVDAPTENPNADYLSFGFSGSGSPVLFDVPANTEIELFRFQNSGPCLGAVALINNASDPFMNLNGNNNSQSTNPGNQMTILGRGGNTYVGNYGGAANCATTAAPDLNAGISGPATVAAGASATYVLSLANVGSAATTGASTQSITLSAGLNYTGFSGSGWVVSSAAGAGGTTILTATYAGVIGAGASASALSINVSAAASGSASASIAGAVKTTGEFNLINNAYNQSISITAASGAADLSASISGAASAAAGSTAVYVVSVTNGGNAATTGATINTITLAAGLVYAGFSGSGWVVSSATGAGGTTILTATYAGVIGAGGSAGALSLSVTPTNNVAGSSVSISGRVSTAGEVNLANNNFSQLITITVGSGQNAPVISASFGGPASLTVGAPATFTLNVANNGPGAGVTTGPITTTMSLPAGVSYDASAGNGWTVTSSAGPNSTLILTAVYSPTLGAGSPAPPLVLTVTPSAPGAGVIAGQTTTPGAAAGSPFSHPFTVVSNTTGTPDLGGTLTGPTTTTTGSPANFTLILTNTGTGATTGPIATTLSLPAGVSYDASAGTGWTVSSLLLNNGTTSLTATYSGTVGAGGAVPPLVLTVMPSTAGLFTVAGSTSTPGDSNPANNGISVSSTAVKPATTTPTGSGTANLSTSITIDNRNPNQNDGVRAVIVVTNSGPNAATGVISQATLPTGQPITSRTPSAGTTFVPGTGVWTIGTLSAGQSVSLVVTLSAAMGGIAFIGNEITASGQFDPNSTPNNHVDTEDDQVLTCFTVPLNLCAGRSVDVGIGSGYTNIQWYRGSQLIAGATSATLTITTPGTYTVRTNGSCLTGDCCGITVTESIDCCAPSRCIPIVITRIR